MAKRGLMQLGSLGIAVVCLIALIQLFSNAAWFLSPAGRVHSDVHAEPPPPRDPVGNHTLDEWPAERGREFRQAPTLDHLVESGVLPPVEERLPENPLVVVPPQQYGPYGGTWRRFATSVGDVGVFAARLAYEGLVRWDPMGREVWPNLATHWDISSDAREYTFYLRRGVRWSDGEPFTADDLVFWYEDVAFYEELSPVPPPEMLIGGEYGRLEKLDDYTIRITFNEPNGLFMKHMASGFSAMMLLFPAHYFRQFHPRHRPIEEIRAIAASEGLASWQDVWRNRTVYVSNPEMPHLWAWGVRIPSPAQPVEFARNPYYWKVDPEGNQLPYIDAMTFDIFDAELINMKAIEGAIGMQMRHIMLHNYPLFMAKQRTGGYRVLDWINGSGGTINVPLNLNHNDPVLREVFSDGRFRKALSLAINRDEMNMVGYYGLGAPRQCAPPRWSRYYDPAYEQAYVEYDPETANALLDDMGLTERNNRGVRLRPDGRPFQLFIDFPTMVGNAQLMELVAQYWTDVGIKTDVKLLARELFYQRKAGLMQDVAVWWPADEQEPLIDPRWFIPFSLESNHAIGYARWFMSYGRSGIEPEGPIREAIELYRQIERTPDEDRQVELFQKILDLNREHLWVIGTIGDVPAPVIVKDTFRNVPDEAISGWIFRTPGNTAPECYAIEGER